MTIITNNLNNNRHSFYNGQTFYIAVLIMCCTILTGYAEEKKDSLTIEQLSQSLQNVQAQSTNSIEEKSLSSLYNKVRGKNTWDTEVSYEDKQTLLNIVTNDSNSILIIHKALIAYWSSKIKGESFSSESLQKFASIIDHLGTQVNFDKNLYEIIEKLVQQLEK